MSGRYDAGQGGPVPGNPYARQPGGFGPPPASPPSAPPAYAPAAPPPPAYAPAPAPAYPTGPAPAYGAAPSQVNPEFLVADSRSAIVVDESGVTFDFEGDSAEFPWPEILSVHSKPGAGHRLMVAVMLPNGKFYECVVKARNRVMLEQWFRELGHVLHVYLSRRENPPPWTPRTP